MVCYRALLRNLVEQGLLVGSVDEMYDAKLHRVFMPHGIGHFIGGKSSTVHVMMMLMVAHLVTSHNFRTDLEF